MRESYSDRLLAGAITYLMKGRLPVACVETGKACHEPTTGHDASGNEKAWFAGLLRAIWHSFIHDTTTNETLSAVCTTRHSTHTFT